MNFAVIYLAAMLAPGAVVTAFLGIRENRVGFSLLFSLSILVFCLVLARLFEIGTSGYAGLLGAVGVLLLLGLYALWRSGRIGFSGVLPDRAFLIAAATLSAVALYTLWAGPYLEIPADGWYHIGQINEQFADIGRGDIGAVGSLRTLFGAEAEYWYTIAGFFIWLGSESFERGVVELSVSNSLLFSAGVYSFALFVFRFIVVSRLLRHAIAGASVFFFFAHFGIGVFSYPRYYVFAPAFLNFVVYLTAISCVIHALRGEARGIRFFAIFVVSTLLTAMLHVQETLFVMAMTGAMVAVSYVRARLARPLETVLKGGEGSRAAGVDTRTLGVVFWSMVVIYGVFHVSAYLLLERHDPLVHGRMIDLKVVLPFLENLYILKPTYQFYQVITVWGVFLYGLFLVGIRHVATSPYLVAGMLMPVMTLFNPLFTDLFLRFSNPVVLWRLSFVMPLPFVGAYFFVLGACRAVTASRISVRLGGVAVVVALVALLLPFESRFFVSPHSKVYMLLPVDPRNDHRVWKDLIDFLAERDTSGIITDRITGYVLDGMTKHHYRGWKFTGRYAPRVREKSYDDEAFAPPDGWKRLVRTREFKASRPWLVIVNRRNGANSTIGRKGRHWYENTLEVSRLYSPAFLDYLEKYPAMFVPIWENAGIEVYEIHSRLAPSD
ncbi:MAG: hypothetical protein DWQ08_04330 [Proteobacteria bacterium]|nr:MAG: hypothetical protein DWQ08_04330 [Pseudomonadota bacterium]